MKKISLLLLCLTATTACDDFFETDISSHRIEIISPVDSASTLAGQINFRWQRIPQATGYRLIVVTPSFDTATHVAADTLIYADTLSCSYGCMLNLKTGHYAWQITAFNSGYKTTTEEYTLDIIELSK